MQVTENLVTDIGVRRNRYVTHHMSPGCNVTYTFTQYLLFVINIGNSLRNTSKLLICNASINSLSKFYQKITSCTWWQIVYFKTIPYIWASEDSPLCLLSRHDMSRKQDQMPNNFVSTRRIVIYHTVYHEVVLDILIIWRVEAVRLMVASMLVTDVGDQMCRWQDFDVGDKSRHLHPELGTNIKYQSPHSGVLWCNRCKSLRIS